MKSSSGDLSVGIINQEYTKEEYRNMRLCDLYHSTLELIPGIINKSLEKQILAFKDSTVKTSREVYLQCY